MKNIFSIHLTALGTMLSKRFVMVSIILYLIGVLRIWGAEVTVYTSNLASNLEYSAMKLGSTQNSSNCKWVETEIGDIHNGDQVMIAMSSGNYTYLLPNAKNTSSSPTATDVSKYITGNELNYDLDDFKWKVEKTEGGYIFHSSEDNKKWLYCIDDNDGVRVGTNENKIFTIDATTGHLLNTATSRYIRLGTTPDGYFVWRCYETNKAGQSLKFYKRECSVQLQVVEWKENSVVIMYNGDPAQTATITINK